MRGTAKGADEGGALIGMMGYEDGGVVDSHTA